MQPLRPMVATAKARMVFFIGLSCVGFCAALPDPAPASIRECFNDGVKHRCLQIPGFVYQMMSTVGYPPLGHLGKLVTDDPQIVLPVNGGVLLALHHGYRKVYRPGRL